MDFETLKKKPVRIITENNILDDAVRLSDDITILLDKTDEKINKNFRDFLIVILNNTNKIQFIITYKELSSFLNTFRDFVSSYKSGKTVNTTKILVQQIKLDQFAIKLDNNAVEENIEIQKALDLIKNNHLEVLVVVDKQNKPVGKIKRSSLKNKFAELID